MGTVCVVTDLSRRDSDKGDDEFVLKFPKLQNISQEIAFRKEASVWVSLGRHPAIIPAYWVDIVGSRLCVAAEFVEADVLGRSSLREHLTGNPKPLRLVVRWASQFLLGMEHSYSRGLSSHGDIKPENLLVDRHDNLRIMDFGLARATADDGPTRGGTPAYMPSEQWLGRPLDERSDLYAFGLVLCELCYGGRPSKASTVAALKLEHLQGVSGLPDHALRPLISKMLKAEPAERCSLSEAHGLLRGIAVRAGITLPVPLPQDASDQLSSLRAKSSIEGVAGGAKTAFEAALEITRRWPSDASGWTQLGRLYLSINDIPRAHAATVRSLELDDTRTAPWNNLGIIWGDLGEPRKALMAFRRALECDPDNTGAMLNMASPLCALGERKRAIQTLRGAITLAPDKYSAWVNLAGCLWDDGQADAAIVALQTGRGLAPPTLHARLDEQRLAWLKTSPN